MLRSLALIAAAVLLAACAGPKPYLASSIVPLRADTSWTVQPDVIRGLQTLGYTPYLAEDAVQRIHDAGLQPSLGAGQVLVYAEKHRGCGLLGIIGCKKFDVLIVAVGPESPSTGWPVGVSAWTFEKPNIVQDIAQRYHEIGTTKEVRADADALVHQLTLSNP